jgi:hypothetical protein
LCPGLLVPFGPPRHPAFPSGHALTAQLTTGLLLRIDKLRAYKEEALIWLAMRVARNRERAGLHYPSDSVAGQRLADVIVQRLAATDASRIPNPLLDTLLASARAEWQGHGPI